MINFDMITNGNNKIWSQIPDNPYRMLTVSGSGSK